MPRSRDGDVSARGEGTRRARRVELAETAWQSLRGGRCGLRGRGELASYRGSRYNTPMIQSFACADTERLFNRVRVARFASIEAVARRKLDQLNAAADLSFLRVPPGNRLKSLKGDRAGQYSIRINDQFRVCFVWGTQGPENVEIVDCH